MLELNVKDLRKNAKIRFSGAPDGHVFGVRDTNNGDGLKLSELARKKGKLLIEAGELQNEFTKIADKPDVSKQELSKKIDKLVDKISAVEEEEIKVNASVFDDFGDGSLSLALYLELSDIERKTLIAAVTNGSSITEENNGETSTSN